MAQIFLQGDGGAFLLSSEFPPRSLDAICGACAVSLAAGDVN